VAFLYGMSDRGSVPCGDANISGLVTASDGQKAQSLATCGSLCRYNPVADVTSVSNPNGGVADGQITTHDAQYILDIAVGSKQSPNQCGV
jgi:hypothetical protein